MPQENERTVRILVVEDVWMIAMGLKMDLEREGYQVLGPVGRVEDAMPLIGGEPPDGALLDINLDGESVFPLAEALDQRGIPYVFLTGYDEGSQVPERFRDRPVMRKPYQYRRLSPLVARLFGPSAS